MYGGYMYGANYGQYPYGASHRMQPGMGMGMQPGMGMGMPGMGMGMNPYAAGMMAQNNKKPKLAVYPAIPGIPVGLEPLEGIESLSIRQQLEMVEIMYNMETNNRYDVFKNPNERIYYAVEDSKMRDRIYMGKHRPFIISILDGSGQAAITVERPCSCALCFWGGGITGSDLIIKSGVTGELYGSVVEQCNCCTPKYYIFDEKGQTIMLLKGPCCGSCCSFLISWDAQFEVYQFTRKGKQLLGAISKRFDYQEFYSDATNFGMKVPADLDVKVKAVLLGAIFCLDFNFYEENTRRTCSFAPAYSWVCTILVLLILIGIIVAVVVLVPKVNKA